MKIVIDCIKCGFMKVNYNEKVTEFTSRNIYHKKFNFENLLKEVYCLMSLNDWGVSVNGGYVCPECISKVDKKEETKIGFLQNDEM